LDLGHLNVAVGRKILGMDLMDFINKIKDWVGHIHAHDNYGEKDEHNPLGKGNFPWENVLSALPNVTKIVFENRTMDEVLESKKLIEDFYRNEI
jgi:sugar phosphate isomerase/epimerase